MAEKDTTIEKLWNEYSKILPEEAGVTQIKETRRAFYAGATSMFILMCKASEHKEVDAIKIMTALDAEIRRFTAGLGDAPQEN